MKQFRPPIHLLRAVALIGPALVCAPARAAPTPSQLGESARIKLNLTTSVRYDDNVFLASSDPRSDTIISLAPGADLNWGEASATHLGLVAQENIVRYLRDSVPDDSLTFLQFSGGIPCAHTNFTCGAEFEQLLGNTRDLRGSADLARHDRTTAHLDVDRELTARTSLQTGLAYDRDKFLSGDFHSTYTKSLPLTLSYILSPKVNLHASYSYHDVSVSDSGDGFVDQLLGLGASGEFTPKLSGHLGANWTHHSPDAAPTDDTLGFDCSLAWTATARMSWSVTAAQDFRASASTGGDYSSTRVGLQNNWAFAEFWSTQAGVQYEGAAYAEGRQDRLYLTTLSLNYAPSTFATFSVNWIHELNHSNVELGAYDRNAMSLSATFRY